MRYRRSFVESGSFFFVGRVTLRYPTMLSVCRCDGGLGIVASDVTGFGVAWGLGMLRE